MRTQKLQIILIALLVLVVQNVFSQAPEIEWQNTIGGNADDYLTTLIQTTDGGYLICGYSFSKNTGDKLETRQGGSD